MNGSHVELILFLAAALWAGGWWAYEHRRRGGSLVATIACPLILVAGVVTVLWSNSDPRGTARHGKIEEGRFYLGNRGTYTEVDRDTFHHSRLVGHLSWTMLFVSGSTLLWMVHTEHKARDGQQPPPSPKRDP